MTRRAIDQLSRDPLTGLLNRATFIERIREGAELARAEGRPVTLVAVDLARFASFNERHGAATADELLLAVGARVAGALRPDDTIARINGDVFAALLGKVPASLAREVAQRLLVTVTASYAVGPNTHILDAVCGLATVEPHEDVTPVEIMHRAEVALQYAKATRTPIVMFEPRLEQETRDRMTFNDDLARACRENELRLVYQPLFDARTGQLRSVEALMRWEHPTRGLIPPAEFIPAAESSGHIIEMGLWALTTACRQQRAWRAQGQTEIDVAVNFSARQLAEWDVVDRVREIVNREAFDPRRVKLEITESLLVEDMGRAVDVLTRLRTLGLRLSVDDFGTGYSSLSRLGELPIDELKIDRYFVEGIGSSGPRETILTAAIAMAHGLGLTVVAEGVETEEQLAYLRAHNCDYIQGFLVGRPIDPGAVLELAKGPAGEVFSLPVPRSPADETPTPLVPAVLPSAAVALPRRLFAR
jgi:diguanylate cyclase (GGDEF)-like protein